MTKLINKIKDLNNTSEKGFTVLETLVAIAVLILSLTAAFSVAQNGLSLSMSSRDEVTAYYLAQEGVEVIRNIRDENSLNGFSWLTGISSQVSDPCYFGSYCAVDSPNQNYMVSCGAIAGNCPVLLQDRQTNSSTYGMYGLNPASTSGWTPTVFKRELLLEQINSNEVALTVKIYWTKGTLTRNFVVHENLFNWQR
ncbi:MAG: hypothetical protein WA051_00380 [Minisyncoccia bacterium]